MEDDNLNIDEKNRPLFSIVTSLYCSAQYLSEFYERTKKAVESITDQYEIIFVNDGSNDDSLEKAIKIQQDNSRVSIIDLSRNFGQHKAYMAGMEHAQGQYVFLIEADLEELPEWIIDFYQEIKKEKNVDVIYGQQKHRKGKFFERLSGLLFYKIFNFISETKIPESHITVRLMTRRYVKSLLEYQERESFLGAIYELAGFEKRPYLVSKLSHSRTTYTMKRKLALFVNGLTSFSTAPLLLVFWIGLFVFILSMGSIAYVVIRRLSGITPESGWTSIIASIWAVGGLIMLSMGVIGIYLKKVLVEVKRRPNAIVRHIYKTKTDSSSL
ncbi:glycosyltransferase family 2 protein [Verrucomicrobiota bacterium]